MKKIPDFCIFQCSCSGENPNCYRCGGWGYLDKIGKRSTSSMVAGASNKKSVKKRPTVKTVVPSIHIVSTGIIHLLGCSINKVEASSSSPASSTEQKSKKSVERWSHRFTRGPSL